MTQQVNKTTKTDGVVFIIYMNSEITVFFLFLSFFFLSIKCFYSLIRRNYSNNTKSKDRELKCKT
jgi:hypothetical protein